MSDLSTLSGLRIALVALLVASTALFAAGVIAERSHTEPASIQARENGEAAGADADQAGSAHHSERETLLGVDLESTPLIVLAVIAGLGLAGLAAAPPGRRPAVLLTIAAIAVAWAALDVREAVHQIDESRTGLAILAIGVATLHLAAAALAAALAVREHAAAGSHRRPDTLPA